MRGFRDIKDVAKNLRALGIWHRLVPASEVGLQAQKGGFCILLCDAFDIGQQTVLLDQSAQMFTFGRQTEKQFFMQRQILRRRSLAIHPILLLTAKQLHFVKPHDHFTVERQLRGWGENDLGRRTPTLF